MRRTFDNPVVIGGGLVLALLVLIVGLTYRNTRQLNEDTRSVAHTHEVLNLTSDVMLTLVDAETGQRGFLITGKDEFLQPYDAALVRLDGLMAKLKDKTKDNSDQQARITKLEEMTAVRLGYLRHGIDLYRKNAEEASAFIAAGTGKAQMDAIRRHVAEMVKVEDDLLKARESKTALTYQVAVTTGLLTGVLGLLTVGAFVWLLRRSLSARQKAAAILHEQREWFRLTLASIGDGVIATDTEGKVTFLNAVAQSLTGWTEGEAKGTPLETVFDIVNEETRKTVENPTRRALKEGRIMGLANHTVLISKIGNEYPIDDSASPIRNEEGNITGAVLVFRDITERKHQEAKRKEAEDGLRRNEQFSRSLMDGTADCVKVLDLDGRLLHMNTPGLCAMEIDDLGPLCGQEWGALWPSDARGDIERSVTRAVGGEVSSFQAYCPTAKGTPKWWEVTVSPVRDADGGRVVRLLSVSRDITERKQVEDRLRASEAEFRAAFEQSAVGMGQVSAKTGWFIRVNAKYCELTGYSAEELAEMTPTDLTFAEDRDTDVQAIGPVLRGEVALYDQEKRYLRKDGKIIWVHVSAALLRNADGRPERTMAVVQDISERKWVEEALRESEERYRAATEAVSDLIWTNNADGLMEGEQRGWGDFTGQSREEYQGYGWSKMVHPEDAQPTIEAWTRAVAEKRAFLFEHRIRRRDGEWRVCSIRAVPILNADGTIREWVGVHTDITERKRDEEGLRRLAAELSEAHQRKDEFLATLAHELRNPLAPIRNGLQLMKLAGGQAATVEQARSMMERQLTQMVRLVDDLVDVSRISRDKVELKREQVELAAVVNSAVETSRPLVEQMGHQLTVTLPDQPVVVDADLTRLAQVFLNLLNNAAKYSDRGGNIQLIVERQGSDVVVTVKDTGIGIDADQLPRIFEMFMQVDRSLEKSQGGLGIGLTLVKRLVEMHGGRVEAKSEGPGKGSEFVVRLPVVIEPSKARQSGDEAEQLVKSSQRILVVDDNRDGADSLSEMLKIMGNDTRTAYDGQEGVDVAGAFRPDVLLLDIGLPKLNGYEACRRIREQPWGKDVVLIAVTGWGQDDDRRRSQEAGFDHHMVKPVDPQALIKMLAGLQVAKK